MRILFTGGGTGGHVFPIIAVARELKKIYSQHNRTDLEMVFLGANSFTKEDLEKEEITVKTILAGKIRRYFSIENIIDLFKIPIGILQSLLYLFFWMPDVIFSKGGYGSVPVVLVGWLYRIPILIHESDAVPGLANRLTAKFSKKIAISFAPAGKYFPAQKTALVGNPIRLEFVQACLSTNPQDKEKAKNNFKIVSQKPIIFVLGGSQGAKKLNEVVLGILPQFLTKYEIIHQCGSKNYPQVQEKFKQTSLPSDYHLFPFLDENQIAQAYLLADLVVSRAGAGCIFEIAACNKPSILIPLPEASADHQKENAIAYGQTGAALIISQANLTPNLFLNEIAKILDKPELIQKMTTNAKKFSQVEAASKIAEGIIEMGR